VARVVTRRVTPELALARATVATCPDPDAPSTPSTRRDPVA
jgi:hypothetical protein